MARHRGHGSSVELLLPLLLLLLSLSTIVPPCLASALEARASHLTLAGVAAPVSVAPDQNWMGIDGKWNTVGLRVGDPSQRFNVFVSTASQQTWLVHSLACLRNETDPETGKQVEVKSDACFDGRGRTFNISQSSSWQENGFYQLWTEKNLGLVGNGQYGYETVGLGQLGEEGPTLKNTTVGTIISPNFWLGHFGVNPKPTNFSAFKEPAPSYISTLFGQDKIPSLSFGYTAGAQYRDEIVLSSLTLGGYDASRFIPNDFTFGFAPDNERDIVVGIIDITTSSTTKTNISLLNRDEFTMYIDSTIAELWMPVEVCEAFEETFGLKYDNATQLYLVDNQLHDRLLAENPSITFSFGRKYLTNSTVNITLPYAAFDLEASPPYRGLENATRYFPLRRGANENQYVLGRTFLQEAYLLVDWERQNFSIYQVDWKYNQPKDIVPIYATKYDSQVQAATAVSRHFTTGSIIGIALGTGFAFALIVSGFVWWCCRRRRAQKKVVKAKYAAQAEATMKEGSTEKHDETPKSPIKDAEEGTNVFPKAELPAESSDRKDRDADTLVNPGSPVEVENTERPVYEMMGDLPTSVEAGGRQLSEKESMMVRERIYNGVDPNGTPEAPPRSEEPPRRPPPLLPSDVALVNRRLPNASPISPLTPRDRVTPGLEANDTFFQPPTHRTPRDGRFLEAEDTLLSPISPMEGSDPARRRFSYES